jgi:hypothetical protein
LTWELKIPSRKIHTAIKLGIAEFAFWNDIPYSKVEAGTNSGDLGRGSKDKRDESDSNL